MIVKLNAFRFKMYPQLWSALSQLKDFNKNQTIFAYDEVGERSWLSAEDCSITFLDPDPVPAAVDEINPYPA